MEFNPEIHCTTDHGDPARNDSGQLRLRPDWKTRITDHLGRNYNPRLHDNEGDKPVIGGNGKLVVRRRDEARKPMGAQQKLEAAVAPHKRPGYSYRSVNDVEGRIRTFEANDWEVVKDEHGPVRVPVGASKHGSDTHAVLMRKPEEWFEEDQRAKERALIANLESSTQPETGADAGGKSQQYGDFKSSRLA